MRMCVNAILIQVDRMKHMGPFFVVYSLVTSCWPQRQLPRHWLCFNSCSSFLLFHQKPACICQQVCTQHNGKQGVGRSLPCSGVWSGRGALVEWGEQRGQLWPRLIKVIPFLQTQTLVCPNLCEIRRKLNEVVLGLFYCISQIKWTSYVVRTWYIQLTYRTSRVCNCLN